MMIDTSVSAPKRHESARREIRWKQDTRARRSVRLLLEMAVFASAYLAAAHFGLSMVTAGHFASLVWLPTGLAITGLLWRSTRLWPGITIAAFVANVWQGAPALAALSIGAGNALEAVVAVTLLRRFVGFRRDLARVKDVVGLTIFGGVVGPLVSASIGVLSLWLADEVPTSDALWVWYVWATGDALGALIVAPLLLTWISSWKKRPRLEELVLWAAVIATGMTVALGELAPWSLPLALPRSYIVFPPLIWGAIRLGVRWTATASALLSALAIAGTVLGYGRFAGESVAEQLLGLQTFLVVIAITALILAAAIAERNARDILISFASHELRSPLSALSLHYDVLSDAIGRDAPPDQIRSLVGRVQRPLGRLTQLVSELLDMSRVRGGVPRLNVQSFDLRALVEQVAARLEPELAAKGMSIELRLDEVLGRWDRSRLDQVITNLLTNAVKYGGTQPVTVTLRNERQRARLVVEDRGRGIAAKDRERIFEPFVRVGERSAVLGTGLGLSIVKEIVRAHHGRIRVESKLGIGSRFIVELPRNVTSSEA